MLRTHRQGSTLPPKARRQKAGGEGRRSRRVAGSNSSSSTTTSGMRSRRRLCWRIPRLPAVPCGPLTPQAALQSSTPPRVLHPTLSLRRHRRPPPETPRPLRGKHASCASLTTRRARGSEPRLLCASSHFWHPTLQHVNRERARVCGCARTELGRSSSSGADSGLGLRLRLASAALSQNERFSQT